MLFRVIAIVCLFHSLCMANLLEDLFGAGARSSAMGNTGIATSNDAGAVYYNPSLLARCPTQISVGYHYIGGQIKSFTVKEPSSKGSIHTSVFSLCHKLPYHLTAGFYASLNPLNIATIKIQLAGSDTPIFPLYNTGLTQPTFIGGLAFEPSSLLTFGASILIGVNPIIGQRLAYETLTSNPHNDLFLQIDVQPSISYILGTAFKPTPWAAVGLVYRSPFNGQITGDTDMQVKISSLHIRPQQLLMGSYSYSPRQLGLGFSFNPHKQFQISSDIVWQNWAEYNGPFLFVMPGSTMPESIIASHALPKDEAFRDITTPRIGFEWQVFSTWALRTGYHYRPRIVSKPSQYYLDSDVYTFTFGTGLKLPESPRLPKGGIDASFSFGYMESSQSYRINNGRIWDFNLMVNLEY